MPTERVVGDAGILVFSKGSLMKFPLFEVGLHRLLILSIDVKNHNSWIGHCDELLEHRRSEAAFPVSSAT
jgi:hypothetical protein